MNHTTFKPVIAHTHSNHAWKGIYNNRLPDVPDYNRSLKQPTILQANKPVTKEPIKTGGAQNDPVDCE